MTVPAATVEVARYAAQVRAALADLPPEDRDELLDDLEGHLLEVRAEDEGPLEIRLGTPETYAAELRASAGLPAARGKSSGRLRRLEDGLRRDAQRLRERAEALPGGRAVADFLPELRPGWWVLRAWLAVWVLALVFGGYGGGILPLPVPRLGGSWLVGLAVLAGAVVLSVRIGRGQGPSWLSSPRLVGAGNVALLVAAFVAAMAVQNQFTVVSAYGAGAFAPAPGVLTAADGRPISNLYAFDALGRPLRDVQLYDQDGRPVDTLALAGPDGSYAEPEYRVDENGAPRGNVFPRTLVSEVWTEQGPSPAPVPPPAIAPGRLAQPSPTAAPSPAPSPSASPAPAAPPSPAAATPSPVASPR